jgi:hypothetical protein
MAAKICELGDRNDLPESSSSCCHEQNRGLRPIAAKIVDDSLSLRQRTFAIDPTEFDILLFQMPGNQIQRFCPAGEDDTA